MIDLGNDKKEKGAWWAPGIRIMGDVSTWIIVPIVVALVAGKALDAHYGTKPWIFLGLTGVGFLFTCYGFYKTVKDYVKKLKDEASK